MDEIKNWFNKNISKTYVHGSNILRKIKDSKVSNFENEYRLNTIITQYKEWYKSNEELIGYTNDIIEKRVKWISSVCS